MRLPGQKKVELIDGISNKIHLRDWPVVDKGKRIFRVVG